MTTTGTTEQPGAGELNPAEVVDIESPPWRGEPWPLRPGQPIGQTFRAYQDGLCAVEVLVSVAAGADGELIAGIRHDGPDGAVVQQWRAPFGELESARYVRIPLPPVSDSADQRFYLWLDATAPGAGVYATGPGRLSTGSAYRDHEPIDGCIAFRTFAEVEDARLSARREIEALLASRAQLSGELIAARRTIRQLLDERETLAGRLRDLLLQLAPVSDHRNGGEHHA
jgi:hypothetical protein